MPLQLRDYQGDAVDAIFKYFNDGNKGNPIIAAATGAGKSLIIGEFIKRVVQEWPDEKIVMATHVADLVAQNYEKIIKQWPDAPVGIYNAKLGKRQPWCSIVCGSVQTMYKKGRQLGRRALLLIDEAHLLTPNADGMYMKLIAELKLINPYLKVIGFSATPWREKGGSLIDVDNRIFTDIITNIDLPYLIKRGYLSPLIGTPSLIQADLSNVKVMKNGEYNLAQAEAAIDKEELTQAALDEVELLAKDRKFFMFFCSGIKHTEHVKIALTKRGWESDVIIGTTTQSERTRLLNKFRNSKTRYALINNTCLTTGTDLPNADCIVFLRATKSTTLYIQICGRGARPIYAPGFPDTDAGRLQAIASGAKPNCLILDYAGNIDRFGPVDLIKIPRKKNAPDGEKEKEAPRKICPACHEAVHINVMQCPCGFIFEVIEKFKHQQNASNGAIMSSEMKPERIEIKKVVYKPHIGPSGVPSLRVQYYDKYGHVANKYLCFSHVGYPRKQAEEWCVKMGLVGDLPKDTDEAYYMSENFRTPTAIFIIKNGKGTEVLDYEFNVVQPQQPVNYDYYQDQEQLLPPGFYKTA